LVRLNVSDPGHNDCWLPKSSADGIFGGLGLHPHPGSLYRNTPLPRLGGMAIDAGTVARIIHPGPRRRRRF
jgi:hypothetical protein